MSSRALRRLQEQKQEIKLEDDDIVDDVALPVKKNKKASKKGNLFELLSTEDDGSEITAGDEETTALQEEEEPVAVKSKKKRNKKSKGKAKTASHNDENNVNELDEIDRTVNQINQMFGETLPNCHETAASNNSSPVFKNKSILSVDPRNLNTVTEMKRKFGANVVNGDRRRDPHTRRFKRTTSLVTPKDNWPPYTKVGITMSQVKSENNSTCSYFMFEHQEIYRSVQFRFYDALESMDHNNIVGLLNAHPYHVDSMLQLSEICRHNDDHQMAGELIERALFVFECAFHTLFNITQGNCRLDYKKAENRPFFLALYRHITYIGDKACYRTALEFCKVLFGLDPIGDPLGVLLMVDYFALKSEEYNYLIQLYEEYDISRNISLLPNFAFSYALAKFHAGHLEESNKLLRSALITFPSLLIELTEKCGADVDTGIRSHPYFDPVTYLKQLSPLNQLIALYVGRCGLVWKPPEILDWLLENAKYIIDNLHIFEDEINTAQNRRVTCFRFSPQNVLRHILTSEVQEAIRCLPIEVRSQSVMTHDPLPPQDSVIGYRRPHREDAPEQEVNMLSLFLQSLMPSYNQAPGGNPVQAQAVNEDGAQAANEEGRDSVASGAQRLMDVMRDLLNTMTYRNDNASNNPEGEEGAEEQEWEE